MKIEVKSNGVVVGNTYNEGKTIDFLDNNEAKKVKDELLKGIHIGISSKKIITDDEEK